MTRIDEKALAAVLETAWTDFLDANPDDLTSPEDLPNHALMTCQQFVGCAIAALSALEPAPAEAEGWRKQPWMSKDDWNGGRWLSHEEAMQTIFDAASVSTLSYEEAALVYARGRGFIVDDARMMASPPAPAGKE